MVSVLIVWRGVDKMGEMMGVELEPRRAARAFTLPEVLLALALLTVAAVAVGGAVRSSLDLLTRARAVEQPPIGWSIARDEVLRGGSRDEIEQGGRINLPNGDRVRWEADVEETGLPDVFAVQLAIETGEKETAESMILFRPEWSSAVDRGPLMEEVRREVRRRLDQVNR